MKKLIFIILVVFVQTISAQKDVQIHFKDLTNCSIEETKIDVVKFYISNLVLTQNGKKVWNEPKSYHLINSENEQSLSLKFSIPDSVVFDSLKFNLGIDSLTSVSGVFGGDLDPSKGMYWAWNSGYINFKLEGTSDKCNTRKNEFQFHLGGYSGAQKALQNIVLKASEHNVIYLNLNSFFSKIDLAKDNHIMSPGIEAVKFSKFIKTLFYVE